MMRRCAKITASLIIFISLMVSAVSCSREHDFGFKDLCFYHPHTAPVTVGINWNKFRHIEEPTGMTAYVWPIDSDEEAYSIVTHNLTSLTLDLEAGLYNAFVFNQTASEYSTLEFYNLEDYDKAEARVIQTKSSWYETKLPDTKLGEEPEWLAIDCVEGITVTEEMVELAEQEFLASLNEAGQYKRAATKTQNYIGTLEPKSIIKKLDIYVHLENVPFLRSALGAIKKMAEGCYISSGLTSERKVDHTIESWAMIYEEDHNGNINMMKGALKATITTFGLPQGHNGNAEDNSLYVKLLLVDNETIVENEFPIGDIIADLNSYDGTQLDEKGNPIWPEVHIHWPEPLPEVEPVGGGSGAFDVGVGDWGDEIVTELPLM